MPIQILMPALSPTMEEGTLAKWLVKEGDEINAGDVIAEIETDKATMEVEAVEEGVLGKILVPGGSENVAINTVIALILEEGEDAGALEGADVSAPTPQNPTSSPSFEASPGSGPGGTPQDKDEGGAGSIPVSPPHPEPALGRGEGAPRIKASPLAKRLAKEAGLDLATITGTGPGGRIVKRDVLNASASAAAPAAPTAPQAPGGFDLVPLDGMRKVIAARMTESFRDVPHFPLNIDCRLDALLSARKDINEAAAEDGIKISVNDFIIRASALALKNVPAANASYTPEGLKLWHDVDIAVAVAIEGGLITPVVRQAQAKGLAAISAEVKDLAGRAKARKLMPEEYQGGTFTISNMGMMGIKSFASIINQPQACILSIGAGEKRPVVIGDELGIATIMTVTLTCDHRVVDGAIGAEFLKYFKRYIENPAMMLL
ncbi:MAG: pyruvate dehydrogenase complex dihydrolipoamide acetyltransferase [Robiginitomaculum sp.]|nr:pyruvate dehydrogenase complex dihydrolipoamide acetyltransferase [Robiginitomaculum sp.]MDQ7077065.1 pyruvate dehydrogenase complex dihydrolipoamide acetyltransferase [Robiginitomaculum sp.]